MQEGAHKNSVYFEAFEVRVAEGRLLQDGHTVEIEPRAYDLLLHLVTNAGQLVSKEEMVATVWRGAFVSDSAITRAVARLRKALGDDSRHPKFVETAYSRGYRFIAPLRSTAYPRPSERFWTTARRSLWLPPAMLLGLCFAAVLTGRVRIEIASIDPELVQQRGTLVELRINRRIYGARLLEETTESQRRLNATAN